jgi:outer membrane protein assembly factor BamD
MSQKQYYDAIDYFTKLKDRYPFSPYTPMGTIALADAYS